MQVASVETLFSRFADIMGVFIGIQTMTSVTNKRALNLNSTYLYLLQRTYTIDNGSETISIRQRLPCHDVSKILRAHWDP